MAQTIDFQQSKEKYLEFIKQHSKHIQTPNTKINYLQWGNPENPTIIWLHGSFSNAFEISSLANEITNQQFHLIALDYYGHGQTDIPNSDYSTLSLLDDLNTILDSLKIQKCIIGGFSRGAYFATMFYKENPKRVSALILEDGGVSPFLEHFRTLSSTTLKTKFEEDIQNRPKELFEEYSTEEEAYHVLAPYVDSTSNLFKNFSFIKYTNGKYKIYKDLDKIYGMESYENLSRLIQGNLVSNPFANDLMSFPFFNVISTVEIPTLLLEASSENDLFLNSQYYLELKKINNNIQHQTFKNSEHNIHFDQPKEFIQSVTNFLKSHF